MNINTIMNADIKTITPQTSLFDAATMMRDQDIGFLVIVDNDELLGTLTDRDIVTRAVSEGLDMQSCQAREIMTTDVLCCNESDSVEEVAQQMSKAQVQRMPIMSHNRELAGIVSIGDMAQHAQPEKVGQTMDAITESA